MAPAVTSLPRVLPHSTLLLVVLLALLASPLPFLRSPPRTASALPVDPLEASLSGGASFEGIGPGEDFGDYEERYGAAEGEGIDDTDGPDGGLDGLGADDVSVGDWDDERPDAAMSGVLELDDVTLPKLADGRRKLLVLFYAPWDRFSKAMAPEFREAARALAGHENIVLGKVDGDGYWKLAARYDATVYPHLIIFNKGDKLGVTYNGERHASALVDYLMHGKPKGPRVPSLLPSLRLFFSHLPSNAEGSAAAVGEAEGVVEGLEGHGKENGLFYLKTMRAIMDKGEKFVDKELDVVEGAMFGGGLPPLSYSKLRRHLEILKEFKRKGRV